MRAFEAAARHLSFSRAANELRVSHSAISHQIRSLEEELGVTLFRRMHRMVVLTPDGERYLPNISLAFELLSDSTSVLSARGPAGRVTVSCFLSFTQCWLVPRMPQLLAQYPDMELNVIGSKGTFPSPIPREDADVAVVAHSAAAHGGGRDDMFMSDRLVVVCAPQMAQEVADAYAARSMHGLTLLHDHSWPRDWRIWSAAAGMQHGDINRGPAFSHGVLALETAAHGIGVAVTHAAVALPFLESGRLVAPIPLQVDAGAGYFIRLPQGVPPNQRTIAFSTWLRQEAIASTRHRDATFERLGLRLVTIHDEDAAQYRLD